MNRLVNLVALLLLVLMPGITLAQAPAPDVPAHLDEARVVAHGLNAPTVYIDERGIPVMTLTVLGIERHWSHHKAFYSSPAAGKDYAALTLQVTNLSTRPVDFEMISLLLVDEMGTGSIFAWVHGAEEVWSEDFTIDGGQTVTGVVVFEMWADLDPVMFVWSPATWSYSFVYLAADE